MNDGPAKWVPQYLCLLFFCALITRLYHAIFKEES